MNKAKSSGKTGKEQTTKPKTIPMPGILITEEMVEEMIRRRDDRKPDPNRKEERLIDYINRKHYEGI